MPKLRLSAVTIPEMRSTFFAANFSRESFRESMDWADWPIVDDVSVEVPENLYFWPEGQDAPGPATLCRSVSDPEHYKVFKRPSDIPQDEFTPTGTAYGGTLSELQWERFVERLPGIIDFYRIPDTDPPGVMDEVIQSMQRAD